MVPSKRLDGGIQLIPTGPATTVETTPDADVELTLLAALDLDELDKLELVTEGAEELELLAVVPAELLELGAPTLSILNQFMLKPPETDFNPKVCLPAVSVTTRWIVTQVCQPPVLPTVTVS